MSNEHVRVEVCMHLHVCVFYELGIGMCERRKGIMLMGQMLLYLVAWEDILCRIEAWDSYSHVKGLKKDFALG